MQQVHGQVSVEKLGNDEAGTKGRNATEAAVADAGAGAGADTDADVNEDADDRRRSGCHFGGLRRDCLRLRREAQQQQQLSRACRVVEASQAEEKEASPSQKRTDRL